MRRVIISVVILIWIMMYTNVSAEETTDVDIVRVNVEAPEITAYINMSDNLLMTIEDEDGLDVYVDGREIDASNYKVSKGVEATAYVLAVDISKSLGESEYKEIKSVLGAWIDGMSQEDRIAIITFGDEVNLLLDYTDDKTYAHTMLDELTFEDTNTMLYKGIIKAYELSNIRSYDLPDHRCIVLVSDGESDSSKNKTGEYTFDEVLDAFKSDSVPVFGIGMFKGTWTRAKGKKLEEIGQLSRATNGQYFLKDESDLTTLGNEIQNYLNNLTVLEIEDGKTIPDGRSKAVSIVLTGDTSASSSYMARFDYKKEDRTIPELLSVEQSEINSITLSFSEYIDGYDNKANYLISGFFEEDIESITYQNEDEVSVIITFTKNIAPGLYKITLNGITDVSENKNPLGELSYEFRCTMEPIEEVGDVVAETIAEASTEAETTVEMVTEKKVEVENLDKGMPNLFMFIVIGVILIIIVILILVLLIRKRKASYVAVHNTSTPSFELEDYDRKPIEGTELLIDDDGTELLDEEPQIQDEQATVLLVDEATVLAEDDATVLAEPTYDVTLEIDGYSSPFKIDVSEERIIGRSRDCSIVINDEEASRNHAILEISKDALSIRDNGSSNGTKVNDKTIHEPAILIPEDVITIGKTRIKVLAYAIND